MQCYFFKTPCKVWIKINRNDRTAIRNSNGNKNLMNNVHILSYITCWVIWTLLGCWLKHRFVSDIAWQCILTILNRMKWFTNFLITCFILHNFSADRKFLQPVVSIEFLYKWPLRDYSVHVSMGQEKMLFIYPSIHSFLFLLIIVIELFDWYMYIVYQCNFSKENLF